MDKKFKRVLTSLKPSRGEPASPSARSAPTTTAAPVEVIQEGDTIENNITRAINAFCVSGGPGNPNPGEEVLHLPTIVDLAESGPAACKPAAYTIRKNLSVSHNSGKPFVQYNSIMLLRILSDNPGPTFTRNLDDPKFIAALKDLVRQGRDPSVWQILCETLDYLSNEKAAADENLALIKKFWDKEKRNIDAARKKLHGGAADYVNPGAHAMIPMQAQLLSAHGGQRPTLPPMQELSSRISEAQTSAKVLEQILLSTPIVDVPTHELIREFAQRCKLALRSIQGFLATDEATLDESTTTTLIETNDMLGGALEKHRKVVKEAQEVLARQQAEKEEEEEEADGPVEDPFRDQPSPVSPLSPHPAANAGPVQYRF